MTYVPFARNTSLDPGEDKPVEPKMTRAMTKKVVENGDIVPWIIHPATPVKKHNKDILAFVNDEFPDEDEEEKDPEYDPELEPPDDDDEGSLLSGGTPSCTNSRSSFISTPLNYLSTPLSTKTTPEQFRRPFGALGETAAKRNLSANLEASPVVSNYSTRSKQPLRDSAIEDLEKAYIPFDVTPDMYESNVDNEDYATFLQELFAGSENVEANVSAVEDDEDPEFEFCPAEAYKQITDPEELRNDPVTKITKKEVADLMLELNDIAQSAHKEKEAKTTKSMKNNLKKQKMPRISKQIYQSIKNHSENVLITEISTKSIVSPETTETTENVLLTEISNKSITPPENTKTTVCGSPETSPPVMSWSEMSLLGEQIQQHIQILTQMSLLSSNKSQWGPVRDQCDKVRNTIFFSSNHIIPPSELINRHLNTHLSYSHLKRL